MKRNRPSVFLTSHSNSLNGVETIRLNLTPLEQGKIKLPPLQPVKAASKPRTIPQRIFEIYRYLTSKDSLKECSHCGSKNDRRRTIVRGLTVNLKNPKYPIFHPRVSNKTWILKTPILCWLIATPSYSSPDGWCLIKHETSCKGTDYPLKNCSKSGFVEVKGRTGYRKFGRLRWIVILLENKIMPKTFILKKNGESQHRSPHSTFFAT